MSRKIFNYNNLSESKIVTSLTAKTKLYENTISACGCLFYRIKNKKVELLLISYADPNWPKLDDFGGKIDEADNSVYETIARETSEETNNILTKEYISDRLSDDEDFESFYEKQSKYYLVLLRMSKKLYTDTTVFGNFEETDKIKRTINWYDYENVKSKLAYRLSKNSELIKHLDNLNSNLKVN